MTVYKVPDAAEIAVQAAQVKFWPSAVNVLSKVLLAVPAAIGFLAGSLWFFLVFVRMYVRASYLYGFSKGARVKPKPPGVA